MADDADTIERKSPEGGDSALPQTFMIPQGNLTAGDTVQVPPTPPGGSALPQLDYDPNRSLGVQREIAGFARKAQDTGLAADQDATDRANKYQREMEDAYRREGAAADDPTLRPWNADQERASRIRGPIEQFGSVGMIFAMAASAFTRQPMTSALNAGAAAMTAIQQGDEKAYQDAFQAWKDNSQLAIKRFDMEKSMFEDVNKLSTSNMALWRVKRAAIAQQFDDQKTIALLEAGMDPTVLKMDAELVGTYDKFVEVHQKKLDWERDRQLYSEAVEANTRPDMSPAEKLKVKVDALRLVQEAKHPQTRLPSVEQQFIQNRTQELVAQGKSTTEAMEQAHQEWTSRPSAMTVGKLDAQEIERRAKEYKADGMSDKEAYDQAKIEVLNKPTLTDDEATYMARQYMQGDKSVLQNLGRGIQGQANLIYLRKKVVELAKKEDVSPAELATRMTEFSGMLAAQRTLGQRTANVELFNNEAINMMDIAQKKSREVPRTQFPSVNKALLAYERQTGDPTVRAFGAAINTVVNTYAKAINGGSTGTVSDKDHAREILKDADTPEQFDAVLNILKQELQAARTAPGQVRQELRSLSGGGSTLQEGKVPAPANVIRYDAQGNRI